MNTLMIRFFHPLRNSILSRSYQSYSTSFAQTRIIRNRIGLLSYHASSQYLHRDDSSKPKIVTNNSETLWNPNSAQLRKIEILTKRILHEVPVGDLTLKDLTAVRSAMSFYTREVRSMNITRHRFTLSSPEIALSKTYATNIEKLLERVLREEHKQRKAAGGKGIIRADKLMYQHVLDAVATCGMPQKAEDWLEKLHDASLWKEKRYLKPDLVAYNACLTAWARCDGIPYSGQRAESLLKKMIKNDIEPTTTSYNRVISAWGRSGGGEKAAEAAEALLEEMISNQSVIALPDKNSWHSVMEAWSWSESLHSPEKVENLIQRMFEFSNISEEGELMKPDLSTYHILLTSFAKSGRRDLVSKAEHIFDGLFSDKLHVVPNTITFTIMMEVLAKLRVKGNARKAHEILNRMIRFSQLNDNVKPNTFTFNVVIDAYAKSGEVNAADKAEELLLQLEDLYEKEKDDDLKPNIVSFTSTIDAIANTAGRNSISKAQRIYDRVKKRIIEGDKEFAASAIVHASMIKVLSKSGQYGAGEKALKILKDLYTQSCLHNGNQLKLSISLFNSVIDALKNDRAASVNDVEWVIDWMKELSSNGHIDFGPDRISYTSLIAAWSESKHTNALDMVENILKMMENDPRLSPTTVTYAVVINALARSKAPDAPYRAEKLVNKMEILQDDPKTKVKVNTVCYTSLINAWVGSMRYQEDVALRHISSILRKMWTLHETRQYPTKPTLVTYGTIINSLARSSNPRKATIASEYIRDLISRYKNGDSDLEPNLFIFNAVLWVCATTKGSTLERKVALDIALDIFNEMKFYASPDSYTYSTLLHAYSNLCDNCKDRCQQGSDLFKECCQNGAVNHHVLKQLRLCISRAGFRNVLEEFVDVDAVSQTELLEFLPQEWMKNSEKQSRKIFNSRNELRRGRTKGRTLRQESLGSTRESRERRAIR